MTDEQDGAPLENENVLNLYVRFDGPVRWHVCKRCMYAFQKESMVSAAGPGMGAPVMTVGCPRCGAEVPVKVTSTPYPDLGVTAYSVGPDDGKIREMVERALAQGSSAEALADAIEIHVPAMKLFAEWLRANPWFMGLGAAVVAPILTVLLTHWINAPAPSHQDITNIVVNNVPPEMLPPRK